MNSFIQRLLRDEAEEDEHFIDDGSGSGGSESDSDVVEIRENGKESDDDVIALLVVLNDHIA